MFRKLRDLVLAGIVGGLLVLGGTAVADIPDARPSAPDSSHTFYGCAGAVGGGLGQNGQMKPFYALDKSLGNCQSGYVEVRLVPSALP